VYVSFQLAVPAFKSMSQGVKTIGVRVGSWLSLRQAQDLLRAPDITTMKGLRDRAMLAVLLGCGLRRSEVAGLTFAHIQQRDGRWCIVDLVGKHGRVRTTPMPTWVKLAIDAWSAVESSAHTTRTAQELILRESFNRLSANAQLAIALMSLGRFPLVSGEHSNSSRRRESRHFTYAVDRRKIF
jgi:site-specific recombinase XerD